MPPTAAINDVSVSKLSLLQRMVSNDNNDKRKLEEVAESSMARKRLLFFGNNGSDNDSSDSPEEETGEVSSKESLMNLDTSEEKLLAKHGRDMIFSNDGDTMSLLSEPRSP
jgi:hypothetical protein